MSTPSPLSKYLADKKLSAEAFGRLVGADRSRIHRIAKGERGASGLLAIEIERATNGAVPASSVLKKRRVSKRRHGRKVARSAA